MTSNKNILIITYDWPPRNSIAVHRPYAWAKYWSLAGAKVTVLTAKKYVYDEPLDLFLQDPDGVKVVEVSYRGDTHAVGAQESTILSKIKRFFVDLLKKNSAQIRKLSGINFDIRDGWSKRAIPIAVDLCATENINVVVSTYGPRACHLIASETKKQNPKIKWVADYRDMWSLSHNLSLTPRQKRREQDLEKLTLSAANLITTVSRPLAEELANFLGKKVDLVLNGFDARWEDVSHRFAEGKTWSGGRKTLKIVYTGMIYPGWRDPAPLFRAINHLIAEKKLAPTDVEVHFYGKRQPGLGELVASLSASAYVKIHGHVSRELALSEQSSADLLLLLESGKEAARGVLTGKIFEYMVSGKPILSIGSKHDSAIGELIREARVGVVCEENIDLIAQTLLDVVSGGISKIYSPKTEIVKKYSREIQSVEFLGNIDKLLSVDARG